MYSIVTTFILLIGQVNSQYGELASLIGGSITPSLFGSAANGAAGTASGLLGSIGTLYQIAQGALQLTGTGVGILNQAAEGKWFNTVVEEARNANREIQERRLIGNGLEPDYSQFGINFPAPAPGDYDHEETTKQENLIPFSASNITTEGIISTETPSITLFPEEKDTSDLNEKENRNSVSGIDVNENGEEIDRSGKKKSERSGLKEFNSYDHKAKQTDRKLELTEEKVTKLQRFIALLHESNITENDLSELSRLLEEKKAIKSKRSKSTTGSRILFTDPTAITTASTLQHMKRTNKSSITALPIFFRHVEPGDIADNEDNDLLSSTTQRSRVRAVRIKYQQHNQPKTDSTLANFHRPRKFPRRTAYRARLPFVTSAIHTETETREPKQSTVNMNEGAVPLIHLTKRKPDVLGQEFLQPAVLNPFGQSEVTLAAPIFGIFQSPTLSFPPFPQATNIIESQPSYSSFVGSHNKNNVLWPHQNPTHILGQPNTYFNSNSNLLIPHFYNQNTS